MNSSKKNDLNSHFNCQRTGGGLGLSLNLNQALSIIERQEKEEKKYDRKKPLNLLSLKSLNEI